MGCATKTSVLCVMLFLCITLHASALASLPPPPDAYVQLGQLFQFIKEDTENSLYQVRPYGDFERDALRIKPETEIIADRPLVFGDLIFVSLHEDWSEAITVRLIKALDGEVYSINADGSVNFVEYFMSTVKVFIPESMDAREMLGKQYAIEAFEVEEFVCDRTIIKAEQLTEVEIITGEIVLMEDDRLCIVSDEGYFTISINKDTKIDTTFPLRQSGGVRYFVDDQSNMIAISILIYQG